MRLSVKLRAYGSAIALIAAANSLPVAAAAQSVAAPAGGELLSQAGSGAGAPPPVALAQAVSSIQPGPGGGSGPAASSPTEVKEIVVTGTSIRGVGPVGTNVVAVGQQQIQATGAVSVSELTNTVPAITTAGSAPQGQNVYSFYSPQIHQLGGSASNTTLVIMDGLRMPGGGTQYSETDPNIIPISAIDRVEVLADGASSVYGSDAVAGVVNYIVRKTYDGTQINAQTGFGDKYSNEDINFIWGTHTDNGTRMFVAAQFTNQSALANNARSFMDRGNYIPYGGTNFDSYSCAPATIRTPASGSNVFLSPNATTAVANTQANAPCNLTGYGAALPNERRGNVLIRASHDFGDRLTLTGTAIYNQLHTDAPGTPGTISNVTVYGPGSGKGGQINPFFTAPAGDPNATQETVSWVDTQTGNWGRTTSEEDVFYGTVVANYKITNQWSATFSDAFAKNTSSLVSHGVFCTACAYLALNGTAQLTGNPNISDISGQNVIALNMPLTAANALDVWHTGAANATSAQVLNQLYSTNTSNINYNTFNQAKLEAQGPVFRLPAGDARLAVGAEYYTSTLQQNLLGPDNTGPTTTGTAWRIYNFTRDVYSAYGEMIVPVIAPEMNIPLVRKLDVDISGRYDRFSDVGSTQNPKFAVNWEVFKGLKLRANYSTSFVAPPMAAVGDPSQGYLYASGSVGLAGSLYVPVAAYPSVTQVPGCANATVTCLLGLSNNQGLRRQLGGGFDGVKPETGSAWSVGADFTPTFLPGLAADVTLWNNKFTGGVTSPNPNSIVNSGGLHDRLTICPTGCTQSQINTFANVAHGVTISGAVPGTVYYLIDQNTGNVLDLDIQGIDASVNYHYTTQKWGTFRIGESLSYFTQFDQDFGGGPKFSILNTSGYNTTFPSIQTHSRADFGWNFGPIVADLFVNYTGGYHNWSNTSVKPIIKNAAGNPVGGGDWVQSMTTVDLHVAYNFHDGWLAGDQVYIDGNNILDTQPSFYNGNTAGILSSGNGFNGFVANPIGRVMSVGFRAKF